MTRAQAEESWSTLDRHCLASGRSGARRVQDGPGPDAGSAALWPLTQVLAASIDMAALDRQYAVVGELVAVLERHRRDECYVPFPGDRTPYFDDNAWVALALWQLHHQTGTTPPLEVAGRAFRFAARGAVAEGGVRWRAGSEALHTCSTGPAAQAALRLFLLGGSTSLVEFARRHLDWLDRELRNPDGLYGDSISAAGVVDGTVWTYNQGTTMGAHALLFRATGERAHLDQARHIADATLGRFAGGDGWWLHPPPFNAVFFRNLLALQALAPAPGDLVTIDAYLQRAWEEARDERGLFTAGGIGSYDGRPTIDQAGIVQLLALRCWPSGHWADIA